MEILTKSARETKRFGEKFADSLKGGEIVALVGDLGNGKTTFVQGLARGIGIKDRIISPTFILRRDYQAKKKLCHIDLYRIEEGVEREFRNLGVEEFFGNQDTIVVIEWAEKIKSLLPKSTVWISFENKGGDERKIIVKQ